MKPTRAMSETPASAGGGAGYLPALGAFALLLAVYGFYYAARPPAMAPPAFTAADLQSPELARGFEQVLAHEGRAPAAENPEPLAAEATTEATTEASAEEAPPADPLEQKYRAVVEGLLEYQALRQNAEREGDDEAAAVAAVAIQVSEARARRLFHEIEVRKNAQP